MRKTFFLISFFTCLRLLSQESFNVEFLDVWTDPSIPSTSFDIRFNEVYGFSVNCEEYGVIGSSKGTHLLKIQSNKFTKEIFIPGAPANEFVFHRDYHVYQNHLYAVCNEGFSNLQIINLEYLPDSVSIVYDSNTILSRAHNIFIDTTSSLLYACDAVGGTDPNLTGTGIEVIDITTPQSPEVIPVNFPALPDRVHDVYARNDTVFMNCYYDGLQIFNFKNPQQPQKIGHLITYQDQGENHSGWLTENGKYYLLIDETPGTRIKVIDISSLPSIRVVHLFGTAYEEGSIPHNVMIKGHFAFVSYYNEGLRIFDISDITDVKEVGFYDTFPEEQSFKMYGAWGIYTSLPSGKLLVSDRQNGLFLFDTEINNALQGTDELIVFPSPAYDKVTVTIPFNDYPDDHLYLIVTDAKGQVVKEVKTNNQSVFDWDIEGWRPGIYTIALINNDLLVYESVKFLVGK